MNYYRKRDLDFTKLDYIRITPSTTCEGLYHATVRAEILDRAHAHIIFTPEDYHELMASEEYLRSRTNVSAEEGTIMDYPYTVVYNKTLETSRIVYPEQGTIVYYPPLGSITPTPSEIVERTVCLHKWQSGQDLTEELPHE